MSAQDARGLENATWFMRVAVIVVGRLKQGPERELADRYFQRFDEAGRKLGPNCVIATSMPSPSAPFFAGRRPPPGWRQAFQIAGEGRL